MFCGPLFLTPLPLLESFELCLNKDESPDFIALVVHVAELEWAGRLRLDYLEVDIRAA